MMIPITRKEKYINEIAGGGNTAPETPYTRKELFFADILGEVVAPSPITRAEKYLAKIANKYSGELPEPVTRIERFLARAAGMDVTIPTPITREEMFWADYALIGEKELSGIPPLTFVSNGENLADYRIYGASGGVGDKTDNLWNEKATTDTSEYINASGGIATGAAGDRFLYLKVNVSPSTNYVFKWTENVLGTDDNTAYIRISEYTQSNRFIRRVLCNCSAQTDNAFLFYTGNNTTYIDVRIDSGTSSRGQHLSGVMIVSGDTAPTSYEPYGYKIPVVCGGTTTNIYLDEPLAKSGNNADYIDYAAQKRHNSDGTESSVTLPEISTLAGTNTLTVGTEVQPSDVYIKYEGAR